ncbi:LacI family DNA-binding transcriptional regulator [Bacteroidota bacterium]
MKKKSVTTLDDIAQKLNVTKVTVSKALRNHPDISKKKINLIKITAEKMGYYPNIAARNLSSEKTNIIGVIVPVITNFFFAHIIEAIYDAAFKNEYDILLTVSQENNERERKHLETMLSMRVEGIIISVAENTENLDLFHEIKKRGIPLVFFDRTLDSEEFSTVTNNNVEGAFNAVERAIVKGYNKIGHIAGWNHVNIGRERYTGFKKAMNKHNIPINREWVVRGGFGKEDGYKGFMKLYENKNLPDFIFAVTYPVALGLYEAIDKVGMKIPEDIDIICFGNSDINEYLTPTLSCIDQHSKELGEKTFGLLMKHINGGGEYKPEFVKIGADLLIHETCV